MRANTVCFFLILCQLYTLSKSTGTTTTTSSTVTSKSTATRTTPSPTPITRSTTISPTEECSAHNKSCDDCLNKGGVKCFYCEGEKSCKPYPKEHWLPWTLSCDLADVRWAVCWLNFKAMLISVGVIGGSIVLAITFCCIYCCCCRGHNKAKYVKDELKMEREKTERKHRSDDRRAERQERLNEIRRKYGLVKDEPSYERMDA
ncbi:pituitary tumor-transforming gene 1 protein-interacting protein-like isoform X2 [Gigantopelta aegis]|uniref:pituitary tumor-transforming gene 1 protein-interacting protein-like isoform X2 n=1 Tax=Gigantopelta aegis TaxID=1735272 RepID=UPI001B88A0B8|nr:pituitary tumor-transforming gene 1 protein-interacting protein-like isoform X2 [Gigantopelta aegis]